MALKEDTIARAKAGLILYAGELEALAAEVERLKTENEELGQHVCDECDPENYGWVFSRVEGRGACTCMIEAEPFQILLTALETISKAATGEIQIADDDTEGMQWIAGKAMEALHSVLPLDYEAPKTAADTMPAEVEQPIKPLEAYHDEMLRYQRQMAKTAKGFLELDAYKQAAECLMIAEGLKFVIGRIPRESV